MISDIDGGIDLDIAANFDVVCSCMSCNCDDAGRCGNDVGVDSMTGDVVVDTKTGFEVWEDVAASFF